MKELLEYINRNDEFTVSKPLPHVTTIKWGDGWVRFYLHISKEESGYYRCIGAIVITRDDISVEVVNVYKNLHSEKEIINLLEEMISSSLDLKNFMRDKHDILNWGISE